jgi:hypothetical protein
VVEGVHQDAHRQELGRHARLGHHGQQRRRAARLRHPLPPPRQGRRRMGGLLQPPSESFPAPKQTRGEHQRCARLEGSATYSPRCHPWQSNQLGTPTRDGLPTSVASPNAKTPRRRTARRYHKPLASSASRALRHIVGSIHATVHILIPVAAPPVHAQRRSLLCHAQRSRHRIGSRRVLSDFGIFVSGESARAVTVQPRHLRAHHRPTDVPTKLRAQHFEAQLQQMVSERDDFDLYVSDGKSAT